MKIYSYVSRNVLLALATLLFLAACNQSTDKVADNQVPQVETEQPVAEETVPEPTPAATVVEEDSDTQVINKLVLADRLDGIEDHIVAKCGGCSLAMDGTQEHALKVEDYEMHFCSDYCKSGFEKDPVEAILAMATP